MNIKWTLEMLQKEALKYNHRGDFFKKSCGAYLSAKRKGILDKICLHMKYKHNPRYLHEELIDIALSYKNRFEFQKNNKGAYLSAYRRGILDNICQHMDLIQRQPYKIEELIEISKKYKNRKEFQKKDASAYMSALTKGILNQICSHMKYLSTVSDDELYLFDAINKKFTTAIKLFKRKININSKPHIKKFSIDIFVPELNKGIEFDGTYWHSFKGLKRGRKHWPDEDILNYHQIKDGYFKSIGIEILHIKEEDWLRDKEKEIKKCFDFLEK